MVHVAEYKKKKVEEFVNLIKEYPIVAVVNMENLPTAQLQTMREQLRGKVELKMTKQRLMRIAFKQAESTKSGISQLGEHLTGMPALLFTKDNPFTLYKILQKNKSPAPAKAGQTAPKDIVVPAGPTPFAPGPLIGELGMLGIKTGVENGKIAVKEDKVVVKEGEVIKDSVAGVLTRFDIKPMEIGLDLRAAYEGGTIFTRKVLHIDEDEYRNNLMSASSWAFNLACETGYPTAETVEVLLGKLHGDAKSLAVSEGILASETAEMILAKAEGEMLSLKAEAKIPDVVEEKRPEPVVEAPKVEEKKPEPVVETPKVEEQKPEPVVEAPKVEEKNPEQVVEAPKVEEKKPEPVVEAPKVEEEKPEPVVEAPKVEEKKSEPVVEMKEEPKEEAVQKAEDIVKSFQRGDFEVKQEPAPVEEEKVSAETLVEEVRQRDIKEKKRKEALKVPTAHELLERKLKKEKLQKEE